MFESHKYGIEVGLYGLWLAIFLVVDVSLERVLLADYLFIITYLSPPLFAYYWCVSIGLTGEVTVGF